VHNLRNTVHVFANMFPAIEKLRKKRKENGQPCDKISKAAAKDRKVGKTLKTSEKHINGV